MDYENILNEDTENISDNELEESVELDYESILNESSEQSFDNELEESASLDYERILAERCKLNEVTSSTFARLILNNIESGISANQAGYDYGSKFAKNPTDTPLQPRSMVTEDPSMQNANINHLFKDKPSINTQLIEKVYEEVCADVTNRHREYAKEYFESFVAEVKHAGIPFAPSEILNIA